MNEIICPNCKKAFKVDEAGYADILKQVRDHQFEEEIASRLALAEKEKESAIKLAEANIKNALQEKLAEKLCSLSFAEKVFFCNSGAEAVEGAIKVARKYFYSKGETLRNEIITFSGSFHGRTLATLAAAGNPNYSEGFGPMPEGFISVPFADHDAFKRAINKKMIPE